MENRTYKRMDYKMHPFAIHIKALRSFRLKKGLTQIEMAKLLGISHITLVSYERFVNMPRADVFVKWCNILNYDLCQLKTMYNGRLQK